MPTCRAGGPQWEQRHIIALRCTGDLATHTCMLATSCHLYILHVQVPKITVTPFRIMSLFLVTPPTVIIGLTLKGFAPRSVRKCLKTCATGHMQYRCRAARHLKCVHSCHMARACLYLSCFWRHDACCCGHHRERQSLARGKRFLPLDTVLVWKPSFRKQMFATVSLEFSLRPLNLDVSRTVQETTV